MQLVTRTCTDIGMVTNSSNIKYRTLARKQRSTEAGMVTYYSDIQYKATTRNTQRFLK